MKKLSALLSLALGLCLLPAVFAADKKPATPAPTPAKAAAEEQKPVVGILVERKAGGFFNLKVDGGNFVMTFLDADKKPVAANVQRAAVRYRKSRATNRHLLVVADENTLRAPTPVDRPYIFNAVHVVLFDDNEETATETYTVNFRQPMAGDGEGTPVEELTPQQLQKIKK